MFRGKHESIWAFHTLDLFSLCLLCLQWRIVTSSFHLLYVPFKMSHQKETDISWQLHIQYNVYNYFVTKKQTRKCSQDRIALKRNVTLWVVTNISLVVLYCLGILNKSTDTWYSDRTDFICTVILNDYIGPWHHVTPRFIREHNGIALASKLYGTPCPKRKKDLHKK